MSTIRKYLAAFKKKADTGSALIHMPTGTGKTGVIACASHFLKSTGLILVLCPRIALRDQLFRELSGRFFTRLGLSDALPKTVHSVSSGKHRSIKEEDLGRTILVMTIQMLHSLKNRGTRDYTAFKDKAALVIVDEGHYEPAISWREAIRGIKAPKVIFTATPFRNDLKLFDVNYDHVFSYTFHEAVSDKVIRDVTISPRPHPGSPRAFVNEVLDFYKATFATNRGKSQSAARVIIRCDSQSDVRQIGDALKAAGQSYVLIHENFTDGDPKRPHECSSVPNPDEKDAIFWVHQFKLLEGIDDPRFQLLALYRELKNTRAFVQQVGRVLRNPSRQRGAVAHVLDHSNGRQKELWEGFILFDERVGEEGVEIADFGSMLQKAMAKAQPGVLYVGGRFRTPLSLEDVNPSEELCLPLTMNISRKLSGFSLDALCKEISAEYDQQDKACRHLAVNHRTHVFLYLSFRSSPLLKTKCFIECDFGVAVLRDVGSYVCYFDSSGSMSSMMEGHIEQVPPTDLRKLFSRGANSHLTAVSLRNANLGPRVVRSRAISAARIENVVPAFDDHAFVCKTARGYTDKGEDNLVRRYVGFARGKVTDASVNWVPFDDYIRWIDGIAGALEEDSSSRDEFLRYAKSAEPPADAEPLSLLLDLTEVQDRFLLNEEGKGGTAKTMAVEDACSTVRDHRFEITANGIRCTGEIRFDPTAKRYIIDSADLDGKYYSNEPELTRGIVAYLNRHQSFRVIPKSTRSFYTLGAFYSPMLRFGRNYQDEFGLLRVIEGVPSLGTIGSEKGRQCASDGSGWDQRSLFAIVDALGRGHGLANFFGTPDILVCDDMGTEAADFILADTKKRRVVFIHAKGQGSGQARQYAASPLQEVCGQATKNLKYFDRFGQHVPPKAKCWHTSKWSGGKGVSGQVNQRMRKKPSDITTGSQMWRGIRNIIRDPLADIEVWLLLGRILSKHSLGAQLSAATPAPEATQAAYLLFSTMNDVASVGGKLRVLCSP